MFTAARFYEVYNQIALKEKIAIELRKFQLVDVTARHAKK